MTEEYPEGIEALKLPPLGFKREFIQILIGKSRLPAFWMGGDSQDYSEVAIRMEERIGPKCKYSICGTGQIIRPECDEIYLGGKNVNEGHLALLAGRFSKDAKVRLNNRLVINCRRVIKQK